MTIDTIGAAARRSTTIIMRDGAGLFGLRHVTDDATAVGVHAFAFADIASAVAGGGFAVPAAYLLVRPDDAAYVGESGNVGRRLQEHALDPSKAFASEVYVLTGFERRLDKAAVIHFQKRLSSLVESAGVVRLIKGNGPCAAELPAWRIATLDSMFEDALPLFFDAGCRCLLPALPQPAGADAPADETSAPALVPEANDGVEPDDADEDGPMEIGVSTVPIGVEEQELAYGDLWARGYEHQGRFLVAAGSEMRRVPNPSANIHTKHRRQELIDRGAVDGVDGLDDRFRLQAAVAFPSKAIAAKVLAGAHVGSDKWRPLRAARRFFIAR